MPRNYLDIEKTIAETGFFSEYLPPCFILDKKVFIYPPDEKCDLIPPVCFSMSRFNGNDARRNIFIPEIGAYMATREFMRQEYIIKELIEFSEAGDASFSPILGKNDSIIRHEQSYERFLLELDEISSDYFENIAKKIIRSFGAKYVLKLDISNCYSSFYVHMMPAILLGTEITETEYKKYIKNADDTSIDPIYIKYRKLDSIIRQQNLCRTNGLLAGTLYSKVIIESLLTRIDKELQNQGIKHSRYVDDFEVYLYEYEEKRIISIFEKTLKRYGFSLNFEKTELIEFPYYVAENLEKLFLRKFNTKLDTSEVMELFNSFLLLEKTGTKGAIRYLLKSVEKNHIETTSPELFKSYLISILRNNDRSLSKACSLLINDEDLLVLNSADIVLIIELLSFHLRCEHDLEVIWLLYLLIQTNKVNAGDPVTSQVAHSHNELAQLLLLRKSLLNEASLLTICANATSWILLYELYTSGSINENEFVDRLGLRKNTNMYKQFKRNNLHFVEL